MKYLHTAGTICTADRPLRRHMLCMHAHACMLVMADLMSRSGGAHGVHQVTSMYNHWAQAPGHEWAMDECHVCMITGRRRRVMNGRWMSAMYA